MIDWANPWPRSSSRPALAHSFYYCFGTRMANQSKAERGAARTPLSVLPSRALRWSDMCDCDRPRIRFWRDLRSYGKATGWFGGGGTVWFPYENKLCRPSLATFFVPVFWDGRAEKTTRMYGKRVPFLAGAWQVVVQTRRRFPRINWILLLGEVVFANT